MTLPPDFIPQPTAPAGSEGPEQGQDQQQPSLDGVPSLSGPPLSLKHFLHMRNVFGIV